MFPQPSWQQAPGVDSSYSDGAFCRRPPGSYCREVPDVSADAAPETGAAIRYSGRWITKGGTSLATPVWAAITALMNEYLRSKGDKPVGFANPLLYRLARATPAVPAVPRRDPWNDTTSIRHGPGYDMVTGLGTPNVWNLARDLAPLTGRS